MKRSTRVLWFALPAAVAAVALLCLAGGAYAHGLADEALTISVTGSGTVTGPGINCRAGFSGDCIELYTAGTAVTLTATADAGATFSGWDGFGGCTGTSSTCTLTMNDSYAITADFTTGGTANPTLTVTATGNGTVTGSGINCGNGATDCSESYAAGTSVTLTETPAAGATFSGWGASCSGAATTCTVTMAASQSVSAAFSGGGGAATATLSVSVSGNGKVTGPGINCGSGSTDCSEDYAVGTSVTLIESPNAGETFAGWGGSCAGAATTCTVSMSASKVVTAIFSSSSSTQVTLALTVTGSGRIVGPGINCGLGNTDCSEIYATNSSVTLAETPASGAAFAGWGGSCSGTASSCTLVMTASKTVTASFSQGSTQKILTVTVGGSGRVSGTGISCGTSTHDCSSAFNNNAAVTLTATPATGAVFLGWGGACSGTGRVCSLVMDSPKAVSASFSTPGTSNGGTFAARSLGSPIVVRTSVGWAVTLRFFTSKAASALLRLSLNGRVVNAFTFSPHSGDVLVGPFNVARPGTYRFRVTLSDGHGATSELNWNLCLSDRGCGTFRPTTSFIRSLGVTASRTATGWLVRVRFQAGAVGAATIRMSRSGRAVSSGTFSFRRGPVVVSLPARQSGFHQIVLTARNAAGRTFQLRWNVLLS